MHGAVQDVGAAEEAGDEHAGGTLVKRAWRGHLRDPAGAHHRYPVGDGERLFQIVGHEQRGLPERAQDARQVGQKLFPQWPVETGHWFIQHQQPRARRQRARQRHALRLAAGESVDRPPAEAAQPHQFQQLPYPPRALGGAPGPHAQAEGDVARHVQMREQRLVLKHQSEAAPVGGHGRHRPTLPAHLAGMRLQPGDHPQQGGLAAPAGAEQGHDLAGPGRQRHVRQHRAAAELDADPPHLQRGAGQDAAGACGGRWPRRSRRGLLRGSRGAGRRRLPVTVGVGVVHVGHRRQKSRAAAVRSRSMAATLAAVVTIRMVASAIPWP